jgi:hypothetical protein
MKKFSLQSLLLLVTLVAVCVGWYVERSRRPELIYMHIYSTHYANNYVPYDPGWDRKKPGYKHNARIATVAIHSGTNFEFHLGDHYDPEIDIEGCITQRGKECVGRFTLFFGAPDLANSHEQSAAATIDRLYPIFVFDDYSFHFALSNSPDPYSLDYKLPLATSPGAAPTGN